MIEKNNDNNALVGFTLMGAIMLFWLWLQPPVDEYAVETSSEDQSEYVDVIKDSDKPVDLKKSLLKLLVVKSIKSGLEIFFNCKKWSVLPEI